jgi:hypothetical protein
MFFVAGYAGASGHKVFRNTTQIASNATVASISANTINILASGNAASQVTAFAMLLNLTHLQTIPLLHPLQNHPRGRARIAVINSTL